MATTGEAFMTDPKIPKSVPQNTAGNFGRSRDQPASIRRSVSAMATTSAPRARARARNEGVWNSRYLSPT